MVQVIKDLVGAAASTGGLGDQNVRGCKMNFCLKTGVCAYTYLQRNHMCDVVRKPTGIPHKPTNSCSSCWCRKVKTGRPARAFQGAELAEEVVAVSVGWDFSAHRAQAAVTDTIDNRAIGRTGTMRFPSRFGSFSANLCL